MVHASELDAIVAVVNDTDGLSIGEIDSKLTFKLARQTLKRRIAKLVEEGRLERRGERKGARYFRVSPQQNPVSDSPSRIPLSSAAQHARTQVRQSRTERRPVGYNRHFLDRYRPNETTYLSQGARADLARIGTPHDANRPAGTYARQILGRLLIDLAWNSSRLEGNTYSLLETERLVSVGQQAEGKTARDAQMILNHKAAIEFLVESAETIAFSRRTILNLHGILADNLLADPSAGGRVRSIPVGIGGSVFMPLEVPQLIDECFQQILDTAEAIANPYEQAFFVMVQLPYLQPFEDVNKRTSRLAANIPFIKRNLCPLSFVDVPNETYTEAILAVYELGNVDLLRDVFIWAYQRSAERYAAVKQSLGEPDPFKLRYREMIRSAVGEIIRARLDKTAATHFVQRYAKENVVVADSDRFVEVVENELLHLHAGNFARYGLRPSEFDHWIVVWKAL